MVAARRALPVVALVALAACDSNPYADLFDSPTGTPTGTLYGTWGGAIEFFEIRWVLAPDHVTIANKCESKIVGIDADADVTSSSISILEAAQAGDDSCFVRTSVGSTPACPTSGPRTDCFLHAGTELTFYGTSESLTLLKLAD